MASVHSYSAHVSWAHRLGAAVFRVKVLLPHSQSPPPRALTSVLGASSHIPLICSLFHFTRSFSQASGGVHWILQCDDLVAWQPFVTTQAFLNDVEIAYVHAFHLNVFNCVRWSHSLPVPHHRGHWTMHLCLRCSTSSFECVLCDYSRDSHASVSMVQQKIV